MSSKFDDDDSILENDDINDDEFDDDDDDVTSIKQINRKVKPVKTVSIDDPDDEEPDEEEPDDEEPDDEEPDDEEPDDEDPDVENTLNSPINAQSGSGSINMDFESFEDDDSDDDEDNYLQKFDDKNKNNKDFVLNNSHPELITHNYDEVETLSKIVRDKNNNIIDKLHTTVPFITKYEIARILGERAMQIESGSSVFTEIDDNLIDSYSIAYKEFLDKKIPFIIKRPLPNGSCEYWKVKDLEIISQ
jgi:DNA-directed RNA polymerase I, II, and III subunit RPABC2